MAGSDSFRFQVHVQPRARRSALVGRHGDAVKLQIAAPPVDGAANAAVVDLVAEILAVPRARVRVAHGLTGRLKTVEVGGADAATLRLRLEAALAATTSADVDKPKRRA